ncbi:hypothetical protein [Streptomyces catenulae]|uniref:Uncharacterized protein n=1 Tax=Streptomyces catenulae TaxID=66875 RepID=A0ABV2YW20_9ACTN|nr:hypothetical protein [Streptomyces catenulae]
MKLTSDQEIAIRRWKLGHHVFHLHLTMMNSHLLALHTALENEEWATCRRLLETLTRLYRASTASMQYASDFPAGAYHGLLRPAMEPPWVSPGFSGKFNADHERMLGLLKTVRTPLKKAARDGRAPDEVNDAARELWREQSRNRANHKLICEKFVPGGTSLLQEYFATSGK